VKRRWIGRYSSSNQRKADGTADGRPAVLALVVGLVGLWGITVLAAPRICPRCGYETSPRQAHCSHCRATLPMEPPAPVPSPLPDAGAAPEVGAVTGDVDAAPGGLVANDVVADEIALARTRFQAGEAELARFFCRNALALNMLTTAGASRDERAAAILKMIAVCERTGLTVEQKCPLCQGTGKGVLETESLVSRKMTRRAGGTCARCEGRGVVRQRRTIDELKFARGQASKQYRLLQQARARVPIGMTWVPNDLSGRLAIADAVALKRATAPPCAACMGFGRTDCAICRGQGQIACTAKGCRNGQVEERVMTGLSKRAVTRMAACAVCGGDGLAPCGKCGGEGRLVCRACGGSGALKTCVRCTGQGLIDCRHCGGSGVNQGQPCTHCRGGGVVECTSCNGTGHQP
jgi:hypothetical protein